MKKSTIAVAVIGLALTVLVLAQSQQSRVVPTQAQNGRYQFFLYLRRDAPHEHVPS
jgi:mannose/fructose/N-acetylgalactosamine-specific phosphotransferase system component IIC